MFRKSIITFLMVALIATSAVCSFASNQASLQSSSDNVPITPFYQSILAVTTSLTFSGSTAKATVIVDPKVTLDYVKMNVKLMKVGSSTPAATWDKTVYLSNGEFAFGESASVTSRGTYYTVATIKCYKDKVLIEEVTKQTPNVVY